MTLLDKILNPKKYHKLAEEKNKKYWIQEKINKEQREKNQKASEPFHKHAKGEVDGKKVRVDMYWMQPYTEHGWWEVSYYGGGRDEHEWFGYACFSSDFKRAGYKHALKEFNKIVDKFGLKETIEK